MCLVYKLYISPNNAGRSEVQAELHNEKKRVASNSYPRKLLL